MEDPKAIYQRLLDEIGAAVEAQDQDSYVSYFALPHRLSTGSTTMMIETTEDLYRIFDGMRNCLALQNVKQLTRVCTAAEYVDDETIRGNHETWLVTPSSQLQQNYMALSTLRLIDGRWQVSDSLYDGMGDILPEKVAKSANRSTLKEGQG